MSTRLRHLRAILPLIAIVAVQMGGVAEPARARAPGLTVDPFVGTLGDFGQLSPAAVAPYGMVQLGPDTDPANHAGYDHAATKLAGFSHTRAVGVGCGGAGGDVRVTLDYAGAPALASIDKRHEQAHAGYYRVVYGQGILAEMTATRGTGAIRFTLPRSGPITLTVDFGHGYSRRISARWQAKGDGDLRADFSAGTVCDVGAYHLHSATRLFQGGKPVAARWQGDGARATLALTVHAGDVVELRTGLSSVDTTAAAAVREAEMGDTRFDRIAAGTLAAWNTQLGRVTITGSPAEQALFYTSLFRVMQTPVAITDPDGRARGSDGKIMQLSPGDQHYSSWALWDNYRTQMPLLALIDPVRAQAIAQSLVRLYASGKQRWATPDEPFLSVRTEHAGIALLDFRRKGITGFDARSALAGMAAESPTLARTTPDEQIEAAYDDWATSELAADLGDNVLACSFRKKALAYRQMWIDTFRDLGADADMVKARGLYQGTLAQYRWAPVFDLPWLAQVMGPRLKPELEHFFADNRFNMTNEPDLQVPFLLAWAGQRDASLAIVRRHLSQPVEHRYTNSTVRPVPWIGRSFALAPQGFADGMDDDAGTMSAWYVWATLGLYPLTPGEPRYVVTKPTPEMTVLRPLPNVRIVLRKGRKGVLTVGGQEITSQYLNHAVLTGMAPASASTPERAICVSEPNWH
jgi:putative alpha-1,2-mannosidase